VRGGVLEIFNLITPIITFTVSLCAMDANILRDAVLVRLENIRFEAYVHINALMWIVAFAELRALTNRKKVQESGLALNPMELNNTFMGTMKTLNEHNASTSTFVMPLQSIPAMKPTAPT
jgi:hypothetical protein